jgi:hypothetical protein
MRNSDLYRSPNITRIMKCKRLKWVGHVAEIGEKRNVESIFMGKPLGKCPL